MLRGLGSRALGFRMCQKRRERLPPVLRAVLLRGLFCDSRESLSLGRLGCQGRPGASAPPFLRPCFFEPSRGPQFPSPACRAPGFSRAALRPRRQECRSRSKLSAGRNGGRLAKPLKLKASQTSNHPIQTKHRRTVVTPH